jgi:hypothetical protein
MSRSAGSDARSAIGVPRAQAAGAVTVAVLPSRFSRVAAWCGTHFRHRGVALGAATSGVGPHVFNVASRRYIKIGTKRETGAPRPSPGIEAQPLAGPSSNMERFRIYVDTSVLGGCFDPEFVTWSEGF